MTFPNTVDDLIRALDGLFAEVTPQPGDDPDKIFYDAGRRSVVRYLKQWRASASTPPPTSRQRGQGRDVRS